MLTRLSQCQNEREKIEIFKHFQERFLFFSYSTDPTRRGRKRWHSCWEQSAMNLSVYLLLLLLSLLLFLPVPAISYFDYQCDSINSPTGNYTANSTYQSNINSLFSALEANSTGTGFAAGRFGTVPDQVSGLILCRGDTNASTCSSCLSQILPVTCFLSFFFFFALDKFVFHGWYWLLLFFAHHEAVFLKS